MNPIERLKLDLLNCDKKVISVRYIVDRLASIERNETSFSKQVEEEQTKVV